MSPPLASQETWSLRLPAKQGASFSEPGGWIERGGCREAGSQRSRGGAGGKDERGWDGRPTGRRWPYVRKQKNLVLVQEALASVS